MIRCAGTASIYCKGLVVEDTHAQVVVVVMVVVGVIPVVVVAVVMQVMTLELIPLPLLRRRCMFPSDAGSAASFSWLIKSGRPKAAASRLAPRLALRLVSSRRCRHLDPRLCCADSDCSCFLHVSTSVGVPEPCFFAGTERFRD